MKLTFTGKNIEITDALRDITSKKFEKLDKFFKKDLEGRLTFSSVKNKKIFEATIFLPNTIIRAEESTSDMYTSIDMVVDRIERQIRKNKTRLQKKYHSQETIRFENIREEVEEDEPVVVKKKNIDIGFMSEEEAILQMELLNHNFFVFKNAQTNDVNVLYKRKDGNYGIIIAE